MRKLPISKSAGFTLIELLVVVSIISLLSGLSLVGYNRFNERQIVVQAAHQLSSDLRLAQQRALSGHKPAGWCDDIGESLYLYQLRFPSDTDSATSYQLRAWCCRTPECDNYLRRTIKTVNLPTGSERISGNNARFYPLTGAANGGRTFTLQGTRASTTDYQVTVTVTSAGGINVIKN